MLLADYSLRHSGEDVFPPSLAADDTLEAVVVDGQGSTFVEHLL